MLNKIILMGRLVKDPELRYTDSNTPVCSFTIACERDFPGPDGEKKADFIDVVAWRHDAEHINKYYAKGSMIAVDGRLQIRDWEDKQGNKRRNAEVVIDRAYFGERKVAASPNDGFEDVTSEERELPF